MDAVPKRGPLQTVRAALQAYVDKDRAAIEALLADDYHFTSPLDNALDRDAYLKICWPGSKGFSAFEVVKGHEAGDTAFVVYEATIGGKRLRNCEMHTVRDEKMRATEVYFGWDLPHPAPRGEHKDAR